MAAQGTLDFVAAQLARAMRPLADAVASPNAFRAFLRRLGWDVTDLPPAYRDLAGSVDAVSAALDGLGDDPGPAEIAVVLDACSTLYDAVEGLDEAPAGVDATEFFAEFAQRLFELLVVDHLARELPGIYSVSEAIGVVTREHHRATPHRPGYVRNRLRLEAFGDILADPPSLLATVYGWGTPDLRFRRIARHGAEFLQAVGINGVAVTTLDGAAAVAYLGADPNAKRDESDELVSLRITIFATHVGDTPLEFGFVVSEYPPTGPGPAGLIVEPLVPTALAQVVTPSTGDLEFPLGSRVTFRLRAGSDLSKRLGLVLKPGDASVRYPFDTGATLPPDGLGVAFVYTPDPPHVLLGRATGSRLEARKATAALDLGQSDEGFEAVGSISADDVIAVVAAADLDGFLGNVVGGKDVVVPLNLQLAWSSRGGFRMNGGAGFEVALDPHVSVGGVRVDELRVGVAASGGTDVQAGIEARTTVGVSGALGPVAFSLAGIGVRARVTFEPGNAGPMDVDVGFVPPNGAGLRIDGGIVSGGGFLRFEPDQHRYSGTFQLRIGNVEVTAIGVLLTQLPDGSPGYSLLITISSEFSPIPLGYGLRLDGVGGLIGIHRTADTVALGVALKAGTVGAALFPQDPVRDANQILAAVSTMFPVARGRYVFGPMAKLSWGVGVPLVTADVGLFLELPQPVRLFLLGQLTTVLPSRDEALVEIHIDVLGVLDFSRGELAIDAALRDSKVAGYPMTGEMALRARWRNDPVFAVALGGMHPDFPLPAGFPTLKRLQIAIGKGDNPRLDLQAYVAVTANTVQFGAALELYAAAGGFNVSGHLGFDALIQLMPFAFQTDLAARVALRRGSRTLASISLDLVLAGPRPWRAKGKGSLSLLFFSISFHFDVTWGGALPPGLPVVDVWPILQAALSDARSWTGVLDAALGSGVRLGADDVDAPARLDPAASLELRQKLLPLGHRVTRFGGAPVAGQDEFRVTAVTLNGSRTTDPAMVEDFFAPAQFEELSDADALSRPSFERMGAGVRAAGATEADAAVVSELTYETILLDVAQPPRRRFNDHLAGVLADAFLSLSAAANVPGRVAGGGRFEDRAVLAGLTIADERYVVAGVADLVARPDLLPGGAPVSASNAAAILQRRLAEHPEEAGTLHVVLAAEAVS